MRDIILAHDKVGFVTIVIGTTFIGLSCSRTHIASASPARRPQTTKAIFTVKDSIEMARFERGRNEVDFSPDRKYFAVVTTRGRPFSDEIEITLRISSNPMSTESLRSERTLKRSFLDYRQSDSYAEIPYPTPMSSHHGSAMGIRFEEHHIFATHSDGKRPIAQFELVTREVHTLTPSNTT